MKVNGGDRPHDIAPAQAERLVQRFYVRGVLTGFAFGSGVATIVCVLTP